MVKLEYTDSFGNIYTIQNDCGPTIYDVMDELVRPILLAAGFHESLVKRAFGEEEEEDD